MMPRKPALVPTEHLHVKLEASTRTRMDLFLYSPLEGRVPKGAHKAFLEMLIGEFFDRQPKPVGVSETVDDCYKQGEPA